MRMQSNSAPQSTDVDPELNNATIPSNDHLNFVYAGFVGDEQRPQNYPRTISDLGHAYPEGAVALTRSGQPSPRSININAEPWAPIADDGSQNILMNLNDSVSAGSIAQSGVMGTLHPYGPRSYVTSSITESQMPHDSGYASSHTFDARSAISWDQQSSNQGYGGIAGRIFDVQLPQENMVSQMQPSYSQESHYSLPVQSSPLSLQDLTCPECVAQGKKEILNFKNQSELEYVLQS